MKLFIYFTTGLTFLLSTATATSVFRTDTAKRAGTTLTDGTQDKRLQGKVGTVIWQSTGTYLASPLGKT